MNSPMQLAVRQTHGGRWNVIHFAGGLPIQQNCVSLATREDAVDWVRQQRSAGFLPSRAVIADDETEPGR